MILETMKSEFNEVMKELPDIITHEFTLEDVDDDRAYVVVSISTEYPKGVLREHHSITLSCYDLEDFENYGIDYKTPDGDVGEITKYNIMTQLYFDLSLNDIEDEYLD